jgi:hypothetical protein
MVGRWDKPDPDLPIAYVSVGDVRLAQGNLGDALNSYSKALAITEHLAKADPENGVRKRDLIAVYGRVGETLAREGKAKLALDAFFKGRSIAAELKELLPDDRQLPTQLAAFDAEIAKLRGKARA